MTAYTAPIDDMRFVLSELADLAAVSSLPGFEEATPDLVDAVLEEAGKFGSEVLAPINQAGDRGCTYENGVVRTAEGFREAYSLFVESGWNGVAFDPEFGGQGLPWLVHTAVAEVWTAANMAYSLCPMLTQAGCELLSEFGSDEMKATYLEKMISGEWTGTMNLTEPQAGSDLARVRMKAVPEGDHYRLSGQKIFITWGEHDMAENIIHMVLARTPDAPDGVKGISLFLVPKFLPGEGGGLGQRNDVRCVSIEHKLGINGSPTAVLSFGDNDGAVGYLVGDENQGLALMFMMMNNARLAVGLEGVGISDRAYQAARDYANERVQGRAIDGDNPEPVAIVNHPNVQRKLMSMKAQSEAARALAYYAAAGIDFAHRHPDPEVRSRRKALVDLLTPVVKAWCSDVGIEVTNTAIQVYGGMGYIEETGVAQHMRDARIAAIYEGTNGIQAHDLIGRKVARENGETVRAFMADVRATIAEREATPDAVSGLVAGRLSAAVADLDAATDWLLAVFPTDPRTAAAGAAHYLRLLAIVAGGWLMAKSAGIAEDRLAAGEGDPAFFRAKLVTARFFAEAVLPQTASLKTLFTDGGAVFADFDTATF